MRAGDAKPDVNGDNTMTLLERLENVIKYGRRGNDPEWARLVSNDLLCAVRDALQQPIMPEQPTDELLHTMAIARHRVYGDNLLERDKEYAKDHMFRHGDVYRAEYHALRAALSTPPKPKMKTVWKFSYTYSDELNMLEQFNTEDRAKQRRDMLSRHWDKKAYTNISPVWSEEVEDK